jgi:hypothetical protein
LEGEGFGCKLRVWIDERRSGNDRELGEFRKVSKDRLILAYKTSLDELECRDMGDEFPCRSESDGVCLI